MQYNSIQLASKHTTVSNDEPFISKLIIYDEGPTSSRNLINSIDMRLSIDMYEMTSLNLSFISNKKKDVNLSMGSGSGRDAQNFDKKNDSVSLRQTLDSYYQQNNVNTKIINEMYCG